jgi:hypothetical protein
LTAIIAVSATEKKPDAISSAASAIARDSDEIHPRTCGVNRGVGRGVEYWTARVACNSAVLPMSSTSDTNLPQIAEYEQQCAAEDPAQRRAATPTAPPGRMQPQREPPATENTFLCVNVTAAEKLLREQEAAGSASVNGTNPAPTRRKSGASVTARRFASRSMRPQALSEARQHRAAAPR